ncbi:MAG: D-alanyl-D-alanine carboxypeptidase family protein [Candidatus Dojkabacteria bacterium]
MNKESDKKRDLPDLRYDEKLFKQAYKAGLEAKRLKKLQKERRDLIRMGLVLLGILCIGLLIFLYFHLRGEKFEYIEVGIPSKHVEFQSLESLNYPSLKINTNISAQSALVFSPSTGFVIYEKNSDERRSIASITKLLTALVVLESFDTEEVIDVKLENIPENLDWQLELKEGDRVKVDFLLKAMLLSSYNNVGYILANAYEEGGYQGFIDAMNSKASTLRMKDSMFSNPAGLDSETNYSTAKDVGKLVAAVLNNGYILDIQSKSSLNVSWNSNGELVSKKIFTTNKLHDTNSYVRGLKTGITKNAGQCFVGLFEYPSENLLITIVLGSDDRFADTEKLERISRPLLK